MNTKEAKKLVQDLMKKTVVEGAKMITSTLMDKVVEDPSNSEVLMEQALLVKAMEEYILKEVEGYDGVLKTQSLKVVVEEDIFAEATTGAEASDIAETTTTCMI